MTDPKALVAMLRDRTLPLPWDVQQEAADLIESLTAPVDAADVRNALESLSSYSDSLDVSLARRCSEAHDVILRLARDDAVWENWFLAMMRAMPGIGTKLGMLQEVQRLASERVRWQEREALLTQWIVAHYQPTEGNRLVIERGSTRIVIPPPPTGDES